MSGELIATVLTGVGSAFAVLVGVWRMVESVRRDLGGQVADVRREIGEVRREVADVNRRIDAVLLSDRDRARAS